MDGSTGTMGSAITHRKQVDSELACPVSPVVDIVFSRWTTPILWTLNEFGRQRFVELQRNIRTITPKVLTQRLRQMERDGLVVRTYHPEVPPRVEYEISELGRSLAPLFAHLADWSAVNLQKVEQARRAFDEADEQASALR
ncbi:MULTISPECIES: helix-turn-helix domain-containing protein [Streptomyces]|uniref:Transcriptional regulator n=1 Tax=Streptomyces sviceus (strain ATCC 29083 / DSM 924 / JCM 4929 / NBRC 13980 / NCIMB 11184 / NRRL 5439 / UC 5370) TaxID=463191 RepID=B5HT23_STRX2|nr:MULTISPECIES: helix-turn-helix domain-containing protein [Streptomyces]EDY55978.2 transcriptional regulator [Streptomyces sviceus ATCC 29083]